MDLDELRTVRRTEREKDSLQHLRDSFYEDVAAYLADLEARRDRAAAEAEDPFASQEVRKLTDKIETAEEVSEAIYERRVGKIVKQASFAAADMSADREGLTEQETALFDDLVERIKQNKTTVLDILAGEGDAGDVAETGATPPAADASDPVSVGTQNPEAASAVDSSTGQTNSQKRSDPIPAGADESVPGGSETPESAPEPEADAGGMLADAMGGEGAAESGAPDAAGAETTETAPEGSPRSAATAGETGAESTGASTAAEDPPAATTRDGDASVTAQDGDASAGVPAGADAGDAASESAGARTDGDRSADEDASADPTPTTDGGATQLDRTTVRITRDVGAILGVDEREYELEREDVVTLPSTNAEPLVERDAAERLE